MLCLREKVFKTIIINMLIRAKGKPGNRYNARYDWQSISINRNHAKESSRYYEMKNKNLKFFKKSLPEF